MFRGTFTALVTPFKNDAFDREAFQRLIEEQIEAGVTGIVPVGTTGESPTLTHQEHITVIRTAVETARGRCKVIAGAGGNATEEAVALTKEAEDAGADGSLQVTPYYNKPSQEGLFRHYKKIADSTKLELLLYSIPGRCGIEIAAQTARRLAEECGNITGIKEAGGRVGRVSELRNLLPQTFHILSGDDALTVPFMAVGAEGVVSVASNIIPAEIVAMVDACEAGDGTRACELHLKWMPLFDSLFVETNPAPVKTALGILGKIEGELRLPLCELQPDSENKVRQTLESLGLTQRRKDAKV